MSLKERLIHCGGQRGGGASFLIPENRIEIEKEIGIEKFVPGSAPGWRHAADDSPGPDEPILDISGEKRIEWVEIWQGAS